MDGGRSAVPLPSAFVLDAGRGDDVLGRSRCAELLLRLRQGWRGRLAGLRLRLLLGTDAVLEEVGAWQNRPLEPVYAIVFFDCLRVKIRDEGAVRNKAVYLAVGVRCSGPARRVDPVWCRL